MSRVSSTPTSGAQPSVERLLGIGPKLMSMSMDSALKFMQGAADILRPAMPSMPALSMMPMPGLGTIGRPQSMCDIPETGCPPRCVCEMKWEAGAGETLRCTIRVRNTSRAQRTFHISATPFTGATEPKSVIAVQPDTLTLEGGRTGAVVATLTVTPEFTPGRYESEILVRGAYEQAVCVTLDVQGEQHCHCEVAQGDPPVRIRAHRWHDHFQCEEPCAPAQRTPNDEPHDHTHGTPAGNH